MKRALNNAKGFTLVELMVVVAIIGILSAVAVPNFRKYQGKAKQSEAKLNLAAVYSVETTSLTDYDTYATCIKDIGFDIPANGYYIIGFSAAEATTAAVIVARGGTCATAAATDYAVPPTTVKKAARVAVVAAADIVSVAPTSSTFTAGAAGNIKDALIDKWQITQTKALSNNVPNF